MNRSLPLSCAAALLFASSSLIAQLEVDRPIHMTGGAGDRYISNLEAPAAGTHAANKDYVDAVVSASGGDGRPTMISNESATAMTFGAALRYCKQLNEGEHTDWYLPNEKELFYVLSKGGIPVSNDNSTNNIWFAGDWVGFGGTSWDARTSFRLSDGAYNANSPFGSGTNYVRCIR